MCYNMFEQNYSAFKAVITKWGDRSFHQHNYILFWKDLSHNKIISVLLSFIFLLRSCWNHAAQFVTFSYGPER